MPRLKALLLLCALAVISPAPTLATPGDTCAAATHELGLLPTSDIDTTVGRDDTNSYGGPCADATTGVAGSGVGEDLYYRIRTSASCTLQVTMNPVGTTPLKNLGLYVATDCAPLSATNCLTMDDNGGGGVTELVTFAATAGTDYYILVDGTNGDDDSISMSFSSSVGDCGSLVAGPPPPVPPTITNGPPPGGTLFGSYNFAYTSTGSPTFSVTSGNLPVGLVLSAAGVITGTPTISGTSNGEVTATNGTLPDAVQAFSISIGGLLSPPTITNGPPPGGTVGSPYNFVYTHTGSPTFAVTSGALPPGLTLVGHVISGTPTTAGTFNGTVTASNGVPPDVTQDFAIVIAGSTADIPTLSDFGVGALALLLAGLAMHRMRRPA